MASLVWYCSSRTAGQWLDYWLRQRLQWWRKVLSTVLVLCGLQARGYRANVRLVFSVGLRARRLTLFRHETHEVTLGQSLCVSLIHFIGSL